MSTTRNHFGRLVALTLAVDIALARDCEREAVGLVDYSEVPFALGDL